MDSFTGKDSFLPDYHVTARNLAASSENKIHDDEVAAKYGYRGAWYRKNIP
ncbi:MAG: hypothetical protein V3W19_09745 [Desulfatiglandales bacterium]